MRVTITTVGDIIYDGPQSFAVELTDSLSYRGILPVTIPPGDADTPEVSILRAEISCAECSFTWSVTFIVLGEEVKCVNGLTSRQPSYYFPQLKSPPPTSRYDQYWAKYGLNKEMFEDKSNLTQEQLQTKHTVAIDLRESADFAFVENLVGSIPDGAGVKEAQGGYILNISLDHLLRITEHGIEVELGEVFRERMLKRKIKAKDEAPSEEQGAIPMSPNGVSISSVDGGFDTIIRTGCDVTFNIRLNNDFYETMSVVCNGFHIYSPDGAEWNSTTGSFGNAGWGDLMGWSLVRNFSNDGHASDTVGFYSSAMQTPGMPPAYDESVYAVTIGPIDDIYDGLEICIDSSFWGNDGQWGWHDSDGVNVPDWNGPYCYTIKSCANLAPYTPAGWDGPVVASSVQGTHTVDQLMGGGITYVDFCFYNEGPGVCDYARAQPYVDGEPVLRFYGSYDLRPGEFLMAEDIEFVLDEGLHEIQWRVWSQEPGTECDESDNEYTFTWQWVAPTISFRGYALYWDMNPEVNGPVPIRHAKIEMWDYDYVWDQLLDDDVTLGDGSFSLGPVDNGGLFEDRQDVFFRIYPDNEATYLALSPTGDAYCWETQRVDELASGIYDTVFQAANDQDASGPFFIADVLLEGYEAWVDVGGPTPSQIKALHRPLGITSCLDGLYLNIQSSDYAAAGYPDTFDRDVILHEYGHHLEWNFGFFDGGPGGTHNWESAVVPDMAASEGGAYFLACSFTGSDTTRRRMDDFGMTAWWCLESGTYGWHGYPVSGTANSADSTEAQVACLLWDIYDQPDDDHSACPDSTVPDGVQDSVQFDIGTILGVLLYKNADDGYLADDIDEFQEAWLNAPHSGRPAGMQDVYYEHGITCCEGLRGDVNGLGGETPTLGDVSVLIDHLFIDRVVLPACVEEANVYAPYITEIDIDDVHVLIDHLFINLGPLADCRCDPTSDGTSVPPHRVINRNIKILSSTGGK